MDNQKPGQPVKPDPLHVFLVILALFIALFGQIFLYSTPVNSQKIIPDAFWLVVSGAALYTIALKLRSIPAFQKFFARISIPTWLIWIVISLALSIAAAVASRSFERNNLNNYVPVISFWMFAALCYLLAFLPVRVFRRDWKAWFIAHRREILFVGIILVIGIGLRFYKLGALPYVINGDEGIIGVFAKDTRNASNANPFALRENIGGLYLQVMNIVITLFGSTAFSLRLLPAIGGTLALISTYLLSRQIAGKRVAVLATFLLAVSHTHLNFSRTVAVTYIQGTWLIPLELYFLLSGLEKRSSWRAAVAGILLAVHMNIYISAQIVVGIVAIYMLVAFFLLKKSFRPAWKQVLVFWAGFLIIFIPEASFMLSHPAEFMSRFNADGTFTSGWLANEVLVTGKTGIRILGERVIHAFLSLIYYPANDFYGSTTPVISFITVIFLVLGLGYILVRFRSLKMLLLNGYFWGMTFAVGLFAVPPSADSYRMLMALPAALLIAALTLDQVMEKLGVGITVKPFQYKVLVSFVLASLFMFNVWVYFFDFVGQCRYGGDPQTRFASYLGTYVQGIKSEEDIYLLSNNVYRVGTHESVSYLTQRREIINVDDSIDGIQAVSGDIIIANPDRVSELHSWARSHPGGQLRFFYDCQNTIMLAYQVP